MIKGTVVAVIAVLLSGPAWAFGSGSSDAETPIGQAKALIDQHKYWEAIPLLEKASAEPADKADAFNLLGYSYRKLKEYDRAQAFYEQALSVDSEHRGALEYLGELYLETGRPDDARKVLARLDAACIFGCREYDELKKLIETRFVPTK